MRLPIPLLARILAQILVLAVVSNTAAGSDWHAEENVEPPAASTLSYVGEARRLDGGELLYREFHQLTLAGADPHSADGMNNTSRPLTRHVEYRAPDGTLIARKINDYRDSPLLPDFTLEDDRRGYREQLTVRDGELTMAFAEGGSAESVKRFRRLPELAVADAGFDELVRSQWPRLLLGRSLTFEFASVARQDFIAFEVQKKSESADRLTLAMSLASPWLTWLLDDIELEYDKNTRRLLVYRGLTNITDASGAYYSAEIRYQYPDYSSSIQNSAAQ
ncbi:hypothetical protein ACQUQU_12545 [Thalassolituus sp. LLYu03]|uniref:hypothetical protein n=1 Tax=Thalassolituus sp. LLYu03 TaxID=3421656 RepID=UPI003D2719E4